MTRVFNMELYLVSLCPGLLFVFFDATTTKSKFFCQVHELRPFEIIAKRSLSLIRNQGSLFSNTRYLVPVFVV